MSPTGTYLAVFRGSKSSARMAEWLALGDDERQAREREGMAAWNEWAEKHSNAIVFMGGPLGTTKKVNGAGIEDSSNDLGAFTVVRAGSPDEAARMFEAHPHFAIFPGEGVDVMPVLTIPGRE